MLKHSMNCGLCASLHLSVFRSILFGDLNTVGGSEQYDEMMTSLEQNFGQSFFDTSSHLNYPNTSPGSIFSAPTDGAQLDYILISSSPTGRVFLNSSTVEVKEFSANNPGFVRLSDHFGIAATITCI